MRNKSGVLSGLRMLKKRLTGSFLGKDREEAANLDIYICKECGYHCTSLGFLHGHMESHTPFYSLADVKRFNEMTEVLHIEEYAIEDIDKIPENPQW